MPVTNTGKTYLFGTMEPRPIVNIPAGASYKLRMRPKCFMLCFVKTADAITAHHVKHMIGTRDEWLLSEAHARNERK